MHKLKSMLAASVVCASMFAAFGLHTAGAADSPKITIVADRVWLRTAPALVAANTVAVAKGQFYDLIGRTEDGGWWQLAVPEAAGKGTWLLATLGAPYSGDVQAVPVAQAPTPTATPKPKKKVKLVDLPAPAWIPKIDAKQRAIWQNAVAAGKDPNTFTVVGDCNSQPAVYLRRLASGEFNASTLPPKLQAIVQRYATSFERVSLAAQGGFGSSAMMDPTWADGAICDAKTGDGPFACELRLSHASIVFISLGTQEQYDWKNFERNFRPMIEHALAKGVLPVLVTKADDIETAAGAPSGYVNEIVRKLAAEYDVPLMDFYAATRDLPNGGLIDEGDKDFHQSWDGMDRRILATLQTLAAITSQ